MQDFKDKIDLEKLPKHIAVIMDGNGRWAKQYGKNRVFGHQNGVTSVRETVEACAEIGVEYLTLYAFSTENWSRPKLEVTALMKLLVSSMRKELKTLQDNNIRLNAIGDLKNLPEACYQQLQETIEATKDNFRMTLTLALSYSSRWEMEQMVKKVAAKVKNDEINISDINSQLISDNMDDGTLPDPELLIRTSGERRVSNFLLWQLAYAEFYFLDKYWPEFRKPDLYNAIIDFQSRERRFGKTSEQIIGK